MFEYVCIVCIILMKLKANLHFHTAEDPDEKTIQYNLYKGIDKAAALGFGALAVTCHRAFVATPDHQRYAAQKGIVLIPGVETNLDEQPNRPPRAGGHCLILNGNKDSEEVRTFEDLAFYRKQRPEIFVIAPHPYYYGNYSLKNNCEKYIYLFDAIEQSWFFSKKWFDRNPKAEAIARKYNLPFIATSDTHFFDFFDKSYAVVDVEEKTIPAIFQAIRAKQFVNIISPRNFWRDMVGGYGRYMFKNFLKTGRL